MGPRILISRSDEPCPAYEAAVAMAGGSPSSGYCPSPDLSFDGLLLAGGGDIHPSHFHQEHNGSEDIDLNRDRAEFTLLRAFMEAGKPILGICRGHQVINVGLGGSLIQHIGDELSLFHRRTPGHEEDKVHLVRANPRSWYHDTYGEVFPVNSSHHQGLGTLGEGLFPVLWSEGGIVEGVAHENYPLLSVQFHPERMTGAHARPDTVDGGDIFRYFLSFCKIAERG